MAEASSSVNNGVNVAALIAAREALTNAPVAAQFKWRAACEWKDGTHSSSTVEGFYGLGQEQHHKKTFTFDADHPEVFASEDKGATPVEYVLVGLASCLTAGIAAVAQHRNIQLRSVTASSTSSTRYAKPLTRQWRMQALLTASRPIFSATRSHHDLWPVFRRDIVGDEARRY